jgi:hypothetical protein
MSDIEIIIKVPEEKYRWIKEHKGTDYQITEMLYNRVRKGILLPKYEAEVITRGNCMMCGKELTEGLFFCKECEAIIEADKKSKE